jgi:hypothetical protein
VAGIYPLARTWYVLPPDETPGKKCEQWAPDLYVSNLESSETAYTIFVIKLGPLSAFRYAGLGAQRRCCSEFSAPRHENVGNVRREVLTQVCMNSALSYVATLCGSGGARLFPSSASEIKASVKPVQASSRDENGGRIRL